MSRFGRDVVDQNLLIRLFDANVTALVVLPPNECLSEPSRQYPPYPASDPPRSGRVSIWVVR